MRRGQVVQGSGVGWGEAGYIDTCNAIRVDALISSPFSEIKLPAPSS